MKRELRFLVTSSAAVAAAFALVRMTGGCLDITPLYVPPREASSIEEGLPCRTCLEKASSDNGCGDDIAKCVANPRCDTVYECMALGACLDHPSFNDKINCTLPCLTDAGIVSATGDPTVDILVEVVQCGQERCAHECHLDDAGLNLDAF